MGGQAAGGQSRSEPRATIPEDIRPLRATLAEGLGNQLQGLQIGPSAASQLGPQLLAQLVLGAGAGQSGSGGKFGGTGPPTQRF